VIYVLDTDHASLYQRGDAQVGERLRHLIPNEVAITIVSYEEQIAGRLAVARRAQTVDERVIAYRWLQLTLDFYCRMPVLPFNNSAGSILDQLQAIKLRIGTKDLLIGAIALAHSTTLLTRNFRDFQQIPGLAIEDWTLP